jgi:hypothetical protein
MDTNILVSSVISDEMIGGGRALLGQLDKSDWPVSAALWFLDPDSQRWKLLLASSRVEEGGPKKAYFDILDALAKLSKDAPRIALKDVTVLDPKNSLVQLLKSAVSTPAGAISNIRFSGNTINGHFIEDAYIYRLT